jgi:hypothetical protein
MHKFLLSLAALDGPVAVVQCFLDAALERGVNPAEIIEKVKDFSVPIKIVLASDSRCSSTTSFYEQSGQWKLETLHEVAWRRRAAAIAAHQCLYACDT